MADQCDYQEDKQVDGVTKRFFCILEPRHTDKHMLTMGVTIKPNYTVAQLSQAVAAAQGAILEAAAKLCDEHNRRLMEDWDAVTKEPHLAEKIRALQTEPMAAALAAREALFIKKDQIKYMVERFLRWRLPESFKPDAGISFKPTFNEHTTHPMKHEPVGTNLFDAMQAETMILYMIEGMPSTASQHKTIAEAVKASAEAQIRETVEFLRNVGPDNIAQKLADYELTHNTGALDRYVAAKTSEVVREAKEAAYDRCAGHCNGFAAGPNGQALVDKLADQFESWADEAAERKEAGQ